jgi:uncharacterized protein
MNCPVCSNELKVVDREGIEIDLCPKCRGVWLDRGELEKIIARSSTQMPYDNDDEDDRQRGRRSHESRTPHPQEGRRREGFFSQLFDFD